MVDVTKTSDAPTKNADMGQSSMKTSQGQRQGVMTTSQAMDVNVVAVASHNEKPTKFNGQNFKTWQQKMMFYLTMLNLAKFLKEDPPKCIVGDEEK